MKKITKTLSFLLIFCLLTSVLLILTNIPKVDATSYQTPVHITSQFGRVNTVTGTPVTITMALTPTSGDVLILGFGSYSGSDYWTISNVTETGVTWSGLGNPQVQKKGVLTNYEDSEIWIGIVGVGASTSVTINLSSPASEFGMIANIYEYSGIATSSFLDKTATNSGTSASPTSGMTTTTTQTNKLIIGLMFGFYASYTGNPGSQTSAINGTLYDGTSSLSVYGNTWNNLGFIDNIVSSQSTYGMGDTLPVSTTWLGCIATFKAAAVVGDTTPPTYSSPSTNTTVANANCNFTVSIADETSLANYTFGCNATGTLTNDSVVNISGTSYLANATHALPSNIGYTVQWEVWFADSSNNLNNTGLQTITITAASAWTKTYLGGNTQATLSTYIGVSTNSINPFGTP